MRRSEPELLMKDRYEAVEMTAVSAAIVGRSRAIRASYMFRRRLLERRCEGKGVTA